MGMWEWLQLQIMSNSTMAVGIIHWDVPSISEKVYQTKCVCRPQMWLSSFEYEMFEGLILSNPTLIFHNICSLYLISQF